MLSSNKKPELPMSYDQNNIFARILRGELPCDRVYEDEYVLAFRDIYPVAPIHVLVIPKGQYISFHELSNTGTPEEISGFFKGIEKTLSILGLNQENGYRLISNCGRDGAQTVMHLHFHILAGKELGHSFDEL